MKLLCAQIKINKLLVHMKLSAKVKLQTRLKINNSHMMVMIVSINVVNTSSIQHINAHTQLHTYPSVRLKSLWKSTNITTKSLKIVLWFINNWKCVHHIHN